MVVLGGLAGFVELGTGVLDEPEHLEVEFAGDHDARDGDAGRTIDFSQRVLAFLEVRHVLVYEQHVHAGDGQRAAQVGVDGKPVARGAQGGEVERGIASRALVGGGAGQGVVAVGAVEPEVGQRPFVAGEAWWPQACPGLNELGDDEFAAALRAAVAGEAHERVLAVGADEAPVGNGELIEIDVGHGGGL